MTLTLRFGARSDVGLLRDGNEDAMYAGPRLLAIADGMGGHAAGEVASRVVIEHVSSLDDAPPPGELTEALRSRILEANDALRTMVGNDPALEGMGTTLTALLWVGEQLGLAHVGDSRGYLFRDGQLQMITHDHTLVQNLIDEGRISEAEAASHPQRSAITRALDGRDQLDLDVSMQDPRDGDRYLICSDGLSGYVSEETIAEALGAPDPQEACDRLVELALRAGGPDNISCIVADLVDAPADRPQQPILGGAAVDAQAPTEADDTPASRAAEVTEPSGPAIPPPARAPSGPGRPDEPYDDDDDGPARGSRWVIGVVVAVVLLLVLGLVGSFLYIRTQYYVGATGNPAHVTIYRGVTGSALGFELSRVDTETNLPVAALPDYDRAQLADNIDASSKDDAARIVTALRHDACAAATSSTSGTGGTGGTKKHSKHHRQRSKPTKPSYCTSGP